MIKRLKKAVNLVLERNAAGRDASVFDDDVFIASYPRSGNTWFRFLLGNLISDEPASFANIENIIPDIYQNKESRLLRVPRPRVLKSHEPFDHRYKRVIYLVRDPRDVAVSYYHFLIKTRRFTDGYPIEDFVPAFLSGGLDEVGSWGEHVGSWRGARNGDPGFLLFRYEDLLEDPMPGMRQVSDLLGLHRDEASLRRAVELSTADAMRKMEKAQSSQWGTTKKSRQDKPFVRAARSGTWHDELGIEAGRQIIERWKDLSTSLQYASE